MVAYSRSDLDFILAQIQIAEAQAGGADPASLVPHFTLPFGLRTVDGRFNNLLPGNEEFGAADTLFPRIVPSNPLNDADGDTFDKNGPAPDGVVTNNNYGVGGDVADADPRIISNLLVDMTLNNPAAIAAALKYAGITGADANAAVAEITAAANAVPGTPDPIVIADALTALQAAQANQSIAAAISATNAAYVAGASDSQAAMVAAASALSLVNALSLPPFELDVVGTPIGPGPAAANPTRLAIIAARTAADTALAEANQLVVALTPTGTDFVAGADLVAAQSLVTSANALVASLNALLGGHNVNTLVNAADVTRLNTANGAASALNNAAISTDAQIDASAVIALANANAPAGNVADANAAVVAAQAAYDDALIGATGPTLAQVLDSYGVALNESGSLVIPNVATDEGLSAQFNSWFTFFGQFFDHGLDLVTKGGNGTVYVPLQPDDPLVTHGPDGIIGTGDEITNPALQFIPLTRATPTMVDPDGDGPLPAVAQHENTTTSWVDQNQTYTSHASHQVFLREYAFSVDTNADLVNDAFAVSTGKLIDGANGGIGNWAEVKAQALSMLGIKLTDLDVHNVPLLLADPYGKFIPDPLTGFAQVVTAVDLNGVPTAWVSGTAAGIDLVTVGAVRTGHAFLNDIAHNAVSGTVFDPDGPGGPLSVVQADDDDIAGNVILTDFAGRKVAYDDELLDAHKVTGDGRGNENIALTTVHHVFHSEHNRLVQHTKEMVQAQLDAGDTAFASQWVVAGADLSDGIIQDHEWNGERLFQAAKFGTEMQYQHLVFEEFARKVQPLVNLFGPYNAEIDPSIVAEFAHVVYRFGHSMLAEDVARMNPDGTMNDVGLIEAFLNPVLFDAGGTADEAAGAIIRGSTRQVGNEIDEFIVNALRNNLLGLPLDLAVFNIARARDTGAPSLNEARAKFYAGTGDEQLKPYESWVDLALHSKNELSVVNFIAAYGLHNAVLAAVTLDDKRKAATALVLGDGADDTVLINGVERDISDRFDFLNSTGIWTAANSGLNDIDLWIGGLAEKQQPFGGLLGSTFNFVFETQMENLQDSDRFYYLNRLAGTHFLTELEGNSFAQMVINNTNLGEDGMHLPGDIFSVPNFILEVDQTKQVTGIVTGIGLEGREDPTGGNIFNPLVIRNNPNTVGPDTNYLKFTGGEHVVLGGTDGNDTLIASIGDDTIWGDGGNDRIEGGAGVDQLLGGAGDDIITDINGDDNIKGQGGNDVINSGDGFDLILAGDGNDFTVGGEDANETFGGEGNDFIFAGDDADVVFGDAGDDWIEGGPGVDLLQGDFGAPFQDSAHAGNDIIIGGAGSDDYDSESGDDIMLADDGIERSEGMLGFDWVSYKYDVRPADADLFFTGLLPPDLDAIRDRFDLVEGLSGWDFNDTLRGDNADSVFLTNVDPVSGHNNALNSEAQINLINGLQELLGPGVQTSFSGGNIILGGGGSDVIEGRGGDDIIDGDAKLNVRLSIRDVNDANVEIGTADGMTTAISSLDATLNGKSLVELMFNGTLNPGQLQIVREIIDTTGADSDIDIALFSDVSANYTISAPDTDGFTTVTHNAVVGGGGAAAADGVDRVRNVELLRFTDQTIILGNSITNQTAADTLTISIAKFATNTAPGPEVGDVLTVIGAVSDPDNNPEDVPLSAIDFTWQVEQTAGAGDFVTLVDPVTGLAVTGPTFAPTVGLEIDGLALRVVGTFLDANNFPEFVASDETPPASVPPLPTIAGTIGTPGDDILVGTLADDLFFGNGGNDLIFGLGGNDTAQFSGISANFIFSFTPEGVLEVNDTIAGTETAVFSIEKFRFVNGLDLEDLTLAEVLATIPTPATAGPDTITGTAGDDDIAGLGGDDTISALAGNDVIAWQVGDGTDIIDGGADTDRFRIRGNGESETYRIETVADYLARTSALPTSIALSTEIVVTRAVGPADAIVAQLSGIDDIDINGGGGADTFIVSGDFAGTDLDPNTITITGSAGDDTVDISGLDSSHRIVFQSNGGDDTLIGMLRPQDIIELAAGAGDPTSVTNPDGTITFSNSAGSVTYSNADSSGGDDEDDEDEDDDDSDDDSDDTDDSDDDEEGTGQSTGGTGNSALPFVVYLGTGADDTRVGGLGHDTLAGEGGEDTLFGLDGNDNLAGGAGADQLISGAGDDILIGNGDNDTILAGAGNDTVLAGSGDDTVFGDDGNDLIFGNEGRDVVNGGAGNDTIFASIGDGDDVYNGGEGSDTLDLEAITASLVVDLGSSGIGSSASAQSGIDTLSGIENVKGGSGNDTIIASNSVNVLNGGGGDDTFVFKTAAAANGDTIEGFQPGDTIDLSPLYNSLNLGNPGGFEIVATFDAAGQLKLHVVGEDTIIEGNTDNDNTDVDFSIKIAGRTNLTSGDFA